MKNNKSGTENAHVAEAPDESIVYRLEVLKLPLAIDLWGLHSVPTKVIERMLHSNVSSSENFMNFLRDLL